MHMHVDKKHVQYAAKTVKDQAPKVIQSIVIFNNQNSIVLSMRAEEMLCLLHDNRIFAFELLDPLQKDTFTAQAQNVILELLILLLLLSHRLTRQVRPYVLLKVIILLRWNGKHSN